MASIMRRIIQQYRSSMTTQACAITLQSLREGNGMRTPIMLQLLQITSSYHQNSCQETSVCANSLGFHNQCFHPAFRCLMSPSYGIQRYSTNRKKHDFPELRPEELEERFVRGSGPGGQAVNQTANCVVLKHIPSGIVVKCHETRSLLENQKIARRRLQEKLDFQLHGDESYLGQQRIQHRIEKMDRRKRAKEKLALKKAFKERSSQDSN